MSVKPKLHTQSDHGISPEMIDPDALLVIERLQQEGFEAYAVGGCVRDLLLGHAPKDFDISTSAKPEEVRALFRRALLIGRRFRLAHVRFGRKVIEVSTFRQGDIEDDSLIVSDNIWGTEEEDVLRRDFTINGLLYDPTKGIIIDYVSGYKDIQKNILRSIGSPFVRFKQDPVRMIRLLKFRARFGLNVEAEAIDALFECRFEILKSSNARVLEEILRMLESGSSYPFIKLLAEHSVLTILLPKVSDFFETPDGNTIYSFLQEIDQMILSKTKTRLHRPLLLAAITFPILQKHLRTLHEGRKKPMHLGEIHREVLFIIQDVFAPFLFVPKRISSHLTSILVSQYRFTPLQKKKRIPIRIPKTPDFPMALEFFKLRAQLEPGLQKLLEEWLYFWHKGTAHKQSHKANKRGKTAHDV